MSRCSFCRLPRGASRLRAPRHQIATPSSSLSRPFVTVSGSDGPDRQYRYGRSAGPIEAGVSEFTSRPTAATASTPAHGSARSPSTRRCRARATRSPPRPTQTTGGLVVPEHAARRRERGRRTIALLSTDHPYNGSVGLVDAGTPLTVFSAGESQSQFRRYDGSGQPSTTRPTGPRRPTSATPTTRVSPAGPRGLFLLAGTPSGGLEVRRYNGTHLRAAASRSRRAATTPQDHITQDAAGRLHAVFPQGEADGAAPRPRDLRRRRVVALGHGGDPDRRASPSARCAPPWRPTTSASSRWETGRAGTRDPGAAIGPEAPVDPAPPGRGPDHHPARRRSRPPPSRRGACPEGRRRRSGSAAAACASRSTASSAGPPASAPRRAAAARSSQPCAAARSGSPARRSRSAGPAASTASGSSAARRSSGRASSA